MMTEEPVVVAEVAAPAIEAAATVVMEKDSSVEAGKLHKGRKKSTKRNPPYFEMIKDAISSLKDNTGSSQYAIAKFVKQKQKNLSENFKKILSIQLKRLVAQGKLVKVKASYKLSTAVAQANKNISDRPKLAKKKTPAKKPTTKPKQAPKAKVVAKPKPAAKHKPVTKAKTVTKLAAKAKPMTPTSSAEVSRTSTRSTQGKKDTLTQNSFIITKTSSLQKVSSMIAKSPTRKAVSNGKRTKTMALKKSTATRKTMK